MKRAIIASLLLASGAMTLSACSTVRGAAIGGVAGAGVAAVTGHKVKDGAVLGAGAGAVVGTVAN